MLKNYTGHDLWIGKERTQENLIKSVGITYVIKGEVINLPEREEGVELIVSRRVLEFVDLERDDVVAVATCYEDERGLYPDLVASLSNVCYPELYSEMM